MRKGLTFKNKEEKNSVVYNYYTDMFCLLNGSYIPGTNLETINLSLIKERSHTVTQDSDTQNRKYMQ
jgi:hypothetical protein